MGILYCWFLELNIDVSAYDFFTEKHSSAVTVYTLQHLEDLFCFVFCISAKPQS